MFIFLNKLQQISLLLSGNRFSSNRIIDNDGCKLKFKWIFYEANHHLPPAEMPV